MRVVNRRYHKPTPEDVYIGRPGHWGNSFQLGRHGTRDEVCDKHLAYWRKVLRGNPEALRPLVGKTLVCYCKPLRCHGDNYVLLIEEMGYGEEKKAAP